MTNECGLVSHWGGDQQPVLGAGFGGVLEQLRQAFLYITTACLKLLAGLLVFVR
jgi:hypothetical protein